MGGGTARRSHDSGHRRGWPAMAWPTAMLAVLVAVAVLLATTPVDAQSNANLRSQIRELRSQVQSLRVQLADLEQVVHTGASRRGSASDGESEDSGQAARNSRRLAELESDIDEAREWRRRVTGRFEEFDNVLRRLEGRIEQLVADVDFRLSALEQRQGGTTVAPAVTSAVDAPAAALTDQSQSSIAPGLESDFVSSEGPRALGTVPAEDTGVAALPPAGTPEEQYSAAFGLLEEARFEEAHDAFSRFIDANPAHDLAQNAAYWRAESLYARKLYPDAAKAYALNLRQYPEGRKAPDNMVKLGMALLRLGRNEEACRAFEQLDQAFSDPPLNIRRAAQQGRRQANCP